MHSTVGNAQLSLSEYGLDPVAHLVPNAIWNVHLSDLRGLMTDGWAWRGQEGVGADRLQDSVFDVRKCGLMTWRRHTPTQMRRLPKVQQQYSNCTV